MKTLSLSKKLIVDDNPYQKYGLAAAGGTVVSFASILIMALLIATGEVSLDDVNLRKITDVVMPVRDPELIDSIERLKRLNLNLINSLQKLTLKTLKTY